GNVVFSHRGRVHSLEDLIRIGTVWRAGGQIVQPEVLFPSQLARSVGALSANNHRTMDYELWGKFFLAGADFQYTDINFGMFRQHANQKTQDGMRQTQSLLSVARKLLAEARGLSEKTRGEILAELEAYDRAYPSEHWKATGRLARIGLPQAIV